jgi:protein-arginine kinase activator protein McsA
MDAFPVCTHCGFTFGEYRARGLLGCPHCYVGFGEALQGDIAWLHQALALTDVGALDELDPAAATIESASGATGMPAPALVDTPSGKPDAETLARWREQIAAAVRVENYEEAARLNRLIRAFGSAGSGPGLGLV